MIGGVELAWLAGLLEGEGSFLKGPPSEPRRSRITVQMTDEDVIARVAGRFGVSYSRANHHRRNARWKPAFSVSLRGARAVELMRLLRPFMGQRRQGQIDRAIAGYSKLLTGSAKRLTFATVQAIRRSKGSLRTVAKKFDVSGATVRRIRLGLTWKDRR